MLLFLLLLVVVVVAVELLMLCFFIDQDSIPERVVGVLLDVRAQGDKDPDVVENQPPVRIGLEVFVHRPFAVCRGIRTPKVEGACVSELAVHRV